MGSAVLLIEGDKMPPNAKKRPEFRHEALVTILYKLGYEASVEIIAGRKPSAKITLERRLAMDKLGKPLTVTIPLDAALHTVAQQADQQYKEMFG